MKKCPKCGSDNVKKLPCEMTNIRGCPKFVFEIYVCGECGYSEFYLKDLQYFYLPR